MSDEILKVHVLIVLSSIVIIALLTSWLVWAYSRCRLLAVLCTLVVSIEVLAALVYDETRLSERFTQEFTYAQKWEVFAIIATFLLVIVYWLDQMMSRTDYKSTPLYSVLNGSLILSIFLLFRSVSVITTAVTQHYALVFCVGLLFLVADTCTFFGLKGYLVEKRDTTKKFILFSDFPVILSFSGLLGFCFFIHPWLHNGATPWIHRLQNGSLLNTYDYFVPGAIAFQFLASNIIFLVILWTGPKAAARRVTPDWMQQLFNWKFNKRKDTGE